MIEVAVAVVSMIPAMIVAHMTAVAVPVAFKVALAVMMRLYPTRTGVRGTRPVALMPRVAVVDRIPVTGYPSIVGARTAGLNSQDADRRRRTNPDSDRDLSESRARCQQKQSK